MNPHDPTIAAAKIKKITPLRPTLALVLGSGFNHILSALAVTSEIPYGGLPGFPPVGVSGHTGKLALGHLGKTPVLVLSGRAHFYEGHSLETITFPMRVLAEFGVRAVLLTNAAGGINRKFRVGDFMQLTDHINLMGVNPLRGRLVEGRERFVDLTRAYDAGLNGLLQKAARSCGAKLHAGVYLAVSGPSYETPAEIRAFARLGADAVGMSTVPEAIVARQCGLQVAGLSCVTNQAAGQGKGELSHAEVLETTEKVKVLAAKLLSTFAGLYGKRR